MKKVLHIIVILLMLSTPAAVSADIIDIDESKLQLNVDTSLRDASGDALLPEIKLESPTEVGDQGIIRQEDVNESLKTLREEREEREEALQSSMKQIENQNINLSQLPGPSAGGLQGFLNSLIRMGGYLAGSVMLLLLVIASFLLIRGTKESYEQFRARVGNIFIGSLLVFGAFMIVSVIWGIAWF